MDARGIEAKEVVPASRKLAQKEAAGLAKQASKVIVAKGKKVTEFTGGKAGKEVVAAMLGPTGNLRAPTTRWRENQVQSHTPRYFGYRYA